MGLFNLHHKFQTSYYTQYVVNVSTYCLQQEHDIFWVFFHSVSHIKNDE